MRQDLLRLSVAKAMLLRFVAMTFLLVPGLLAPGFAHAQTSSEKELPDALTKLAKAILQDTGGNPVKMGEFKQLGLSGTNAGPGIEFQLADALTRENPSALSDSANLEISGDYGVAASSSAETLDEQVGKLKLQIVDLKTLEQFTKYSIEIVGPKSIAKLKQVTGLIPSVKELEKKGVAPDQIEVRQRKALASLTEKGPTVHLNGMQVSSSAKSPYGVSIEVRGDVSDRFTPRKPDLTPKGDAFVAIKKGELYGIRIHNNSNEPVAAAVTVDAVDVFHFSEDRDKSGRSLYSYYIIQPKTEMLLQGWFRCVGGEGNFFSFQVTDYGKGISADAGTPSRTRSKIGVIQVQFSNCRETVPGENTKDGEETGKGPPVSVKVTPVEYVIDAPHDFVSIRYSKQPEM